MRKDETMAHNTLALLLIFLLFSSACGFSPSGATSAPMPSPQGGLPTPTAETPPVETASPSQVPTEGMAEPIAGGENAVLLFTIGVHIEPFGEPRKDTEADSSSIITTRNSSCTRYRTFLLLRKSSKPTADA